MPSIAQRVYVFGASSEKSGISISMKGAALPGYSHLLPLANLPQPVPGETFQNLS